jgi:hypothetical protein
MSGAGEELEPSLFAGGKMAFFSSVLESLFGGTGEYRVRSRHTQLTLLRRHHDLPMSFGHDQFARCLE